MTAVSPGPALHARSHGGAAELTRAYERHHQSLYRYCRSILRHDQDAQDALQSTMTRALAALQTEERDIDLRPWLFRIAHNEAVSILRRRRDTSELDETLGDAGALEERLDVRETLRLLRHDLADLPERQRCALVLRELNGLAHEEIAAVLGTTPAAIKQAIFEGRSALFHCRAGRDTACGEIRRMLSDGDGRVLRGRGVRAHLRSCVGCRGFRMELDRRPRELAMLAPPLPGAAVTLLGHLLEAGSGAAAACSSGAAGGVAVKAAIVVALAGTGAAALQARTPARETPPASHAAPHRTRPAAVPVRRESAGGDRLATVRVHVAAPAQRAATTEVRTPTHRTKRTATRAVRYGKATAPGRIGKARKPVPPGQLRKAAGKATPPGQLRKAAGKPTPPGQLRKAAGKATPPGQARKAAGKATPPGQARKAARKPGEATPPGRTHKPHK